MRLVRIGGGSESCQQSNYSLYVRMYVYVILEFQVHMFFNFCHFLFVNEHLLQSDPKKNDTIQSSQ